MTQSRPGPTARAGPMVPADRLKVGCPRPRPRCCGPMATVLRPRARDGARLREMAGKPATGQVRHVAERSRFLEQVTRARNDGEPALALQLRPGPLVEVENDLVRAA